MPVQPPGGRALKGSSPATPLASLLGGRPSEGVRQLSHRLTAPHPPPWGLGIACPHYSEMGTANPFPGLAFGLSYKALVCHPLFWGVSQSRLAVSCFARPPSDPLTSVIWQDGA